LTNIAKEGVKFDEEEKDKEQTKAEEVKDVHRHNTIDS